MENKSVKMTEANKARSCRHVGPLGKPETLIKKKGKRFLPSCKEVPLNLTQYCIFNVI